MTEEPQIKLADLGKARGGQVVLESVSLEVFRGDFIAVEGAVGSGKTALLGLLGLLDTPTAGTYLLKGQPTHRLTDLEGARARNRLFGFMFDPPALLAHLNVWQNVGRPLRYAGLSRREQRQRTFALLARMKLSERAYSRPQKLSLEEQQRVALARALVNDPAVLLADEPTRDLYGPGREFLLETLLTFNEKGGTVVLTTRDPEVAARASARYRLSEGRLERMQVVKASLNKEPAGEALQLHVLGTPQVLYRGQSVALAPRQLDLLTLLATHPEGLSGERLLLLAYGEAGNPATLKATLSRLRQIVPIGNRPYRLGVACYADVVEVFNLLERGDVASAVKLYKGDVLPTSDAPGVVELRETLLEALRQAALASGDADAVFTLAETQGADLELWEAALDLLPTDNPKVALAQAHLKRVEKAWGE